MRSFCCSFVLALVVGAAAAGGAGAAAGHGGHGADAPPAPTVTADHGEQDASPADGPERDTRIRIVAGFAAANFAIVAAAAAAGIRRRTR